jgi:hypothetical protein
MARLAADQLIDWSRYIDWYDSYRTEQKFHRSTKKAFEFLIVNPVFVTELAHPQLGIALNLFFFALICSSASNPITSPSYSATLFVVPQITAQLLDDAAICRENGPRRTRFSWVSSCRSINHQKPFI